MEVELLLVMDGKTCISNGCVSIIVCPISSLDFDISCVLATLSMNLVT